VTDSSETTWLSIPEVCERLGLSPGKVHRLVEERSLLGVKRDGIFMIPDVFLNGAEPLGDLRGTLLVLIDGGFSEEGCLEWMLGANEVLGTTPINALWQGRKTEVRRLAHSLAL
jgi:hypothetical protein